MKTYRGRSYGLAGVDVQDRPVEGSGFEMWKDSRRLNPRLDLASHSPTGFAWGFGGSGPAQLALALLADVLNDDDLALAYHQEFKFRVIGRLEQNKPWTLTEQQILEAFDGLLEPRPRKEIAHDLE